jgi:hypothetical protein
MGKRCHCKAFELLLMGSAWVAAPLCVAASAAAVAAPPPAASVQTLLAPTAADSKTYTESFTTLALLADGTYVHTSLMISNIGLHNGRAVCRARISQKDGTAALYESFADAGDWHHIPATATAPESLHVGACTATARSGSYVLEANFAEAQLRMTLAQAPRAVVPPGHPVRVGDAFYESSILVPFASAQGTLRQGSGPQRTWTGSGYADHSRSTTLPKDLGYGWLRFRGLSAAGSRLLLVRYVAPAQGAHSPVLKAYLWRQGEARPQALRDPHIALPAAGTEAAALKVTVFDGAHRLMTLRASRALLREAPLEAYGLMGRLVGSVIGAVQTETYAATAVEEAAAGGTRALPGILEVDHTSG